MWKKKPNPETEIDIEHLPVKSIDRRGRETVVTFTSDMSDDYLHCSLEQHERFVERVRAKFGLSPNAVGEGRGTPRTSPPPCSQSESKGET